MITRPASAVPVRHAGIEDQGIREKSGYAPRVYPRSMAALVNDWKLPKISEAAKKSATENVCLGTGDGLPERSVGLAAAAVPHSAAWTQIKRIDADETGDEALARAG